MPFKVIRKGKKWLVINSQTGSVKGSHPTSAKANAQLRALYANGADKDAKKA